MYYNLKDYIFEHGEIGVVSHFCRGGSGHPIDLPVLRSFQMLNMHKLDPVLMHHPLLTLVFGFELPVTRAGPGSHGPGAEVGVLPGL